MNALTSLAVMTVTAPAQAARSILARSWPREVLWGGLLLSIVLNAMIYTLQQWLFPLPEGTVIPQLAPGAYFAAMLVLQVAFIAMLTISGRWLGGQGVLADLLAVLVWLQLLQAAAQGAVTVLFFVAPALAALANLAVNIFAFFILLHFINEAHRLGSIWRALGVLLMSSLAILFAIIFLLGLIGPDTLGLPNNV
ncbi:YIP1 family protein [Roseobacteraceae bacterium NS-SX3]